MPTDEDIGKEEIYTIISDISFDELQEIIDDENHKAYIQIIDSDLAFETSKDLRDKATVASLNDREVKFIIRYYKHHNQIRNIVNDFEDAIYENISRIGMSLYEHGFIWAAEEARAHLKGLGIELIIKDEDILNAAQRYADMGKIDTLQLMVDRFENTKNKDGTLMLSEETIDSIEQLIAENTEQDNKL